MKIIVGQINSWVGAVKANVDKMLLQVAAAKLIHAELIVFPELAVCGYPPEDLLLREDFLAACTRELMRLCQAAIDIAIVVGCPRKSVTGVHNAAVVLVNQAILCEYHKQCLPNYGVFDEARYFVKGTAACVFRLTATGPLIGLLICEDTWFHTPALKAKAAGAEVLISIHASPFAFEKEAQRQQVYTACSQLTQLPHLCCQTVGGQDDLVFDGGSKAFDAQGNITFAAAYFEENSHLINYDSLTHRLIGPIAPEISVIAKIYQALVLGIKDYVSKNTFKRVLLGLSGGLDSSLTLSLAVDALGVDAVTAVLLPSRFTSQASMDALRAQLALIPVPTIELSIEPLFNCTLTTLANVFGAAKWDKTEENIQARIRGLLLMALANKNNALVLNTSNKSELAVGYSTLYGDMVGGFAALKDVPKTLVVKLAHYRNSIQATIPEFIVSRPPSAELALDQQDQDSLPSYEILDDIIVRFIDQRQSLEDIVQAGLERSVVEKMVKLILQNEHKRRQSPPGVKITACAFTRERRYPISSGPWWC